MNKIKPLILTVAFAVVVLFVSYWGFLGIVATLSNQSGFKEVKIESNRFDILDTNRLNNTVLGVSSTVNMAFETGMKLGYSCAIKGGSKDDVDYIIKCYTNWQVDLASKWFEDRK